MVAGASDAAILPIGMAGFSAARALSRRNDDPATASRPWDLDRDGFVMGEGAGAIVLEELSHAQARGATIYAEFLGGAYTCDAHHMTEPHPDGKGVALAIETALTSAGVARERVNYVNAHGTSTPAGDLAEYKAIRRALPGSHVRINSTKSMIGAGACQSMRGCLSRMRALTRCREYLCACVLMPARGAALVSLPSACRSPAGRCGRGRGSGIHHGAAHRHGARTHACLHACMHAHSRTTRLYVCSHGSRMCVCHGRSLPSQLHPNPNLKNPDPAVDLNIVVGATAQKHPVRARARAACCEGRTALPHLHLGLGSEGLCADVLRLHHGSQVDVALSNSFGFGGHNSCILFSAFKQ
jgi:hypothetical protein